MSIYAFHSQNKPPFNSLPVRISMKWKITGSETLDTELITTSSNGNKVKYKPTYGVLLMIPGYRGVSSIVIPLFYKNWESDFTETENCMVHLDVSKILDQYVINDNGASFDEGTLNLKFLPYMFCACNDDTPYGKQSAKLVVKDNGQFYMPNRWHVKVIKGYCQYYDGNRIRGLDYNLPSDRDFTVTALARDQYDQVANLMNVAVNNQLYNPNRKPTPKTITPFKVPMGVYTVTEVSMGDFITTLPVDVRGLLVNGGAWSHLDMKMILDFEIDIDSI